MKSFVVLGSSKYSYQTPGWVLSCRLESHHYLRNGVYHRQTHHYRASSMIFSEVREAADAVVTVPENFNPQLVIFLQNRASVGTSCECLCVIAEHL